MRRFSRVLSAIGVAALLATVVPINAALAITTHAPSAPRQLVVSSPTAVSLNVAWATPLSDGGAAVRDYAIEYRKSGSNTWTSFTHRASIATSIVVTGLEPVTNYRLRVAATNATGTGPWNSTPAALAIGRNHTCAVLANGSAACWGSNADGALGTVSRSGSVTPVAVDGLDGTTPSRTAVSLANAVNHACAVKGDGSAVCWGDNYYGQLGDGTATDSFTPVAVSGLDGSSPESTATAISVGGDHSCALVGDGSVKCWGWNGFGQLGDGSGIDKLTPVTVSGLDGSGPASAATSLALGDAMACAVRQTGALMCWGANGYGQLGDGTTNAALTPVAVVGLDGTTLDRTVLLVSPSGYHTCAVLGDGSAKCWGYNGEGSFGDGTTDDSRTPVSVVGFDGSTPVKSVVSISSGDATSCAVSGTGVAYCWGYNYNGQVGDGTNSDSLVPAQVVGLDAATPAQTVLSITTSQSNSCAVLADARAVCWGDNGDGALGDGTTDDSNVPVAVYGFDGTTAAKSLSRSGWVSATGTTLSAPSIDCQLPRPTPVQVTDRDVDSIAIRWGAPADNCGKHIDLYRVSYRVKGLPTWTNSTIVRYSQLHLRIDSLKSGVTYELQVRAHNANGLGEPSRIVSETVPVRAPSPIVVKKQWDHRVITLTWLAVQTPSHSPVTANVMSCQVGDGETFRTRVAPNVLTASVKVPTTQLYSCRVAGVTDAGRGFGSIRVFISHRIQIREQV